MEQRLFVLLFFTGVVPLVQSVYRRYHLIQQEKTWSDAQAYCRANYNDLATITTDIEMVRLQNEAQRQQFSSSAWIGLYNDINSWRWSLGNEPLGNMTKWNQNSNPPHPNNWAGEEECGVIASTGWYDLKCTYPLAFVCFDDRNTGNNRYIFISYKTTWDAARNYCRQHHTDLASARNETENTVILGKISLWTWFGLFRDSWKWSDQTNMSTIKWTPGQPDNALWDENCGYLSNSQAADGQCSYVKPFFCHSVITGQKQIVRVKVRSNQDVNDPAVKEAILEKIKQKLKNHGMAENIMVKWRDRIVFHKLKENNTTDKNRFRDTDDL